MEWKLVLQLTGIVLGLLYLWLEYRADIRLWVVGLIMPIVHGVLYYRSGLYADCSMQVYYVLAGLYGWFVWHRACRPQKPQSVQDSTVQPANAETSAAPQHSTEKAAVRIAHTPLRIVPALVVVYGMVHAGIYGLLVTWTNSTVPFWDSFTTALSVVAMWMLSRKYTEQWLVWLVVDLTTVGLYIYKEIPFTAGLYLLYSVLAVAGYLRWRRRIVA